MCLRAGGYLAPLSVSSSSSSGGGRRRRCRPVSWHGQVDDSDPSVPTSGARVSEIFSCLGQRCALLLPLGRRVAIIAVVRAAACAHLSCHCLLCRFCNLEHMTGCEKRNKLSAADFELEFLVFAKFHDNPEDTLGHVTTAWVPVEALEGISAQELMQHIQAHAHAAKDTCALAFGASAAGAVRSSEVLEAGMSQESSTPEA